MSERFVGRRSARLSRPLVALALACATVTGAAQRTTDAGITPALVFTIDVKWLGSSSYRMERDVTTKIETAVKHVPGAGAVHSTATSGRSQTSVSFDPKTDASSTASAIRVQLDQIRMRLPRDASQPLIAWHREPAADR